VVVVPHQTPRPIRRAARGEASSRAFGVRTRGGGSQVSSRGSSRRVPRAPSAPRAGGQRDLRLNRPAPCTRGARRRSSLRARERRRVGGPGFRRRPRELVEVQGARHRIGGAPPARTRASGCSGLRFARFGPGPSAGPGTPRPRRPRALHIPRAGRQRATRRPRRCRAPQLDGRRARVGGGGGWPRWAGRRGAPWREGLAPVTLLPTWAAISRATSRLRDVAPDIGCHLPSNLTLP